MSRPKSETRNRKNLRLIQAMLERLLGRKGEDRRRNLGWGMLEKFSIVLRCDKVNTEREPTKGSLKEVQPCHQQGVGSHRPEAGKGSSGASCPQLTHPSCLFPYKNILS